MVQFLILTLHEELKEQTEKDVVDIINNDPRNKELMYQIFLQDFLAYDKSIISDLFCGINYNMIKCGSCGTQSFNYETYFFLIFPLEEVKIFKNLNNLNNNHSNYNEVNIYDCFFYGQKINYMTESNAMYCNYCENTCSSSICTFLTTGPEILIIILNKVKQVESNTKFNFSIEIDLSGFIDMKQSGCKYELIGFILNSRESGNLGNFIAYCKNPISKEWNKYNDSIVTKIEDLQNEIFKFESPYLLFYQKIILNKNI